MHHYYKKGDFTYMSLLNTLTTVFHKVLLSLSVSGTKSKYMPICSSDEYKIPPPSTNSKSMTKEILTLQK